MEGERLTIGIKQPLIHLIEQVASEPLEQPIYEEISAHLNQFDTTSSILGFTSDSTLKIILKLHQIMLEISSAYTIPIINNYYEAHALFSILEHYPSSETVEDKSFIFFHIWNGPNELNGTEIFLDKDLMWLSVTARGAFNLQINSMVASLLSQSNYPLKPLKHTEILAKSAVEISEDSKGIFVDKTAYKQYMETFVWGSPEEIESSLNKLTRDLSFAVLKNDKVSRAYIENLLVALLGINSPYARDLAIMHLNAFYDDTDWQLTEPFDPVITTCGTDFKITEIIKEKSEELVIELHAPGFHTESSNYLISYHQPQISKTHLGCIVTMNFGVFRRCGFYDWRLSKVTERGLMPVMQPKTKDSDIHSPVQGRFIVHPSDVKDLQIHEVFIDFQEAKFDINTGEILERGSFKSVEQSLEDRYSSGINCLYLMGALERDSGKRQENPEASPLSLICRETPSSLLGGEEGFESLANEAERVGMKLIVDCVARIASKNYHRRYKNKLLFIRNEEGFPVLYYGTDGRSIKYEDSAMLNYRMSEVWNSLIEDVLELAKKFKISGIHVDNAQAWPQILQLDKDEMYRTDSDGVPHYSTKEIFQGLVVKHNANYGYWESPKREKYANPLFVKLCKELWRHVPDFYIIADVWHGTGLENRDKCIAESGPIPRLYDLPIKLSALFGKELHKDGNFNLIEKKNVGIMKDWFESSMEKMPRGAIIVESSTGHSLPYPAMLYGRGAWAAVDILFFIHFIPMTFIGEQAGHAYRSKIMSLYDFEYKGSIPTILSGTNLTETPFLQTTVNKVPRINSTSSLTVIPDMKALLGKEESFQKELGKEYGFDLMKIKEHYKHRRSLRHEKKVLRYGDLIPLVMRHDHGWHRQVLCFARYLPEEVAIITINMNENPVQGYLDLKNLQTKLVNKNYEIFSMGEWFKPENDEYYFRDEILKDKHYLEIMPYMSDIRGLYYCDASPSQALSHSVKRLKQKLDSNRTIDENYLIISLLSLLELPYPKIKKIANNLGMLQNELLEPNEIEGLKLLRAIEKLDETKAARLFGVCDFLSNKEPSPPVDLAKSLVNSNRIGPIVFTCPELGRFSTAGGLAIMVNELSEGLVLLGQEIWAISPYYDRNKKGETNYLQNDPANINWIFNVDVRIGNETFTLGVHRGFEKGVNLLFIHNAALFPTIYADGKGSWVMRQLVVWARGVLEVLCKLQLIPSFIITNDWFTGLVPAYAKAGFFGDTFLGTTFFHIVHNLDPTYEGRLYPSAQENEFLGIHGLPRHFLIDPYWSRIIVNPSRCALMMSDEWATVSVSYRNELLASSPLKELLKSKDKPFAHPNGIPVKSRLEKLIPLGNHLDAKRLLEQKYFHFGDLDNSVCLVSFVGRITQQKGVHLILEAAENLIPSTGFKIQFLVGGPASQNDPYAAKCAEHMKYLIGKYPNYFFADPDNFFYDGAAVNLGSDYGVMPSLFEPGGIVQHEFFVAGTPVIAFKTGGLRDSVHEFIDRKGSGFVFEKYELGSFIEAIERGLNTYFEGDYELLRNNAENAVMDGSVVCRAWLKEIYRLKNKIYYENDIRNSLAEAFEKEGWEAHEFDYDLPTNEAEVPKIVRSPSGILLNIPSSINRPKPENVELKRQVLFRYENIEHIPRTVQLAGSFDKWQIRHPLIFDHIKNHWYTNLQLEKGRYLYKFVLDGNEWVVSRDHPVEVDLQGNQNNILEIN